MGQRNKSHDQPGFSGHHRRLCPPPRLPNYIYQRSLVLALLRRSGRHAFNLYLLTSAVACLPLTGGRRWATRSASTCGPAARGAATTHHFAHARDRPINFILVDVFADCQNHSAFFIDHITYHIVKFSLHMFPDHLAITGSGIPFKQCTVRRTGRKLISVVHIS